MKKTIIFTLVAYFAVSGCSFLDTVPGDAIVSGNMWTTEELAENGINGIYDVFYNKDINNTDPNKSSVTGLNRQGAEALGFTSGYFLSIPTLTNTALLAGNIWIEKEWKFGYDGIHRCNDAIANLHKAGLSEDKYNRMMCEARFLRAFFYHRLNMFFRGVPVYTEPVESSEAYRGTSTAEQVWALCIEDLTFCIENKYIYDNTLTTDYGRPSRGAAYALRGQIYMWMKDYEKAAEDLAKVKDCGYGLWEGEWGELFKFENEKSREMIFPLQFDETTGYSDNLQLMIGARDHYDGWTELLPNPDFVDTYTNADGTPFSWTRVPGLEDWNKIKWSQREVFFLRNHLETFSPVEYSNAVNRIGADIISKYYLPDGNEERIKAAYEGRDPRLKLSVWTPYSVMNCYSPVHNNGEPQLNKVFAYPYDRTTRGADGGDVYHDKCKVGAWFYMWRKYNETEKNRIPSRTQCKCDWPLIRYTDVHLMLAEALNEQGKTDEAIALVNEIRLRAGMPEVTGDQDAVREKIRYERRVELCLEGVNYFDEVRWGTYKDTKFISGVENGGLKAMWGRIWIKYYYKDNMTIWPVPLVETQRNPNLEPTPGWNY